MESIIKRIEKYDSQCARQLTELGIECNAIEKDFLSRRKFHINVISAAARGLLKETAHSIILHNLLHHKIILRSFLEAVVEIEPDTFSVEDIDYPDHNRIDLSLRSKNQFLIIENKVNAAQEQRGQICRYYELAKSEGYSDANIIVLYLNPIGYNMPSLYSRSWDGKGDEHDNRTVPAEKIKVKDFKHDIIKWIKELTVKNTEIFGDEPYLQSAVCQYLDYLEERFQTKNEFNELHDMTEKAIKQELGLTDLMTPDEQVAVLRDRIELLSKLTTSMEKMKRDCITQQWRNLVSETAETLGARFHGAAIRIMNLKVPEVGFDVTHKDYRFHVSLVYWTDGVPYWRIYSETEFPETVKQTIDDMLNHLFDKVIQGVPGWTFYKTTSIENAQLRLAQLAELFIGSNEFEIGAIGQEI